MTARLNNRITSLERTMNPKEGIANAIRRAYREMASGASSIKVVGGRIASDIMRARADQQVSEV